MLIREKGGWKYILDKFDRSKDVVREHQPEYDFLEAIYESMPRIPNSIVFAGNSLTKNCNWSELFLNIKIRSRGIGGDCTAGVLERIDEILEPPPAKIFIELGLSDLARGYSQQEIIENYEKILMECRAKSPSVELFIQSVLPVRNGIASSRPFTNKDIVDLNEALKKMSKKMSCNYVDLYPHFVNQYGELDSAYTNDGVHITAEGYSVWKKVIDGFVN